jgi:hypothetical protein
MTKLIKQPTSKYEPERWKTEDSLFTVTNISHRYRSGASHAKTVGAKYQVERENGDRYKTSTLKDAKWWVQNVTAKTA